MWIARLVKGQFCKIIARQAGIRRRLGLGGPAAPGGFRQNHLVTKKLAPESFASPRISRQAGKPLRTKARPSGQPIAYAVAMNLQRPAKRNESQPTGSAPRASSQPGAFWLSDSGSPVPGGFSREPAGPRGRDTFIRKAQFRRFCTGLSTDVMNHCSSGSISGMLFKPYNLEEPREAPLTISAVTVKPRRRQNG